MKPQKTATISVPPRLPAEEIDRAVAELDGTYESVSVMAGSLSFTTPMDLCGLRAFIEHAAIRADTVLFDCPSSGEVSRYLSRMDFYRDLPPNVRLSATPPTVRRTDRRQNLIELTRIRDVADVQNFMARASDIAHAHFGERPVANACAVALGAATENVIEHAESMIGALAAAQTYESGLELAVVDLGIGIPTTLRRNPRFSTLSDLEALEEALKYGVSSSGDLNRGIGLHELISSVQAAGDSTLVLRSGYAHITISNRQPRPSLQRKTPGYFVPGTWIAVRMDPVNT